MFYSDDINIKLYTDLMEQIKKVNSDWLSIRKSKQYRVGLVINDFATDLRQLKFSKLSKSMKRWLRGAKSRKVHSEVKIKCKRTANANYFSTEKVVVYTAIFGAYDHVPEPYCVPDNCNFILFTDQEFEDVNSIWKRRKVPEEIKDLSNAEKNRYLKTHPDRVFPEYKYSIYVDGNVQIITDLTEYINILGSTGIGIHTHDSRECVYEELEVIRKTGRESTDNIEQHIKYLEETKMPRDYGLLQCNVIVREHNNSICKNIMYDWWNEYLTYTKRDQVSLPHVLYQHGIPVEEIGILGSNIYTNPSFRVLNHR